MYISRACQPLVVFQPSDYEASTTILLPNETTKCLVNVNFPYNNGIKNLGRGLK